jgi:DMSO/TMAO reductase YedYZ molybdopterin-dependent catalytic subunit
MKISRRQLLQWSAWSGTGLLLNGCESTLFAKEVGQAVEPLNEKVGALLLSQKPVPEFPVGAIEPRKLLINSIRDTSEVDYKPEIDLNQYRLTIDGDVAQPLTLSMAEIQKLTLTSMVINHVCVEGWAAIVQWGGVRLQDLAKLVQPKPSARYVYFKSVDNYYESWDLASALHPQTLMAYQMNGAPLPPRNGAPLRLASPIKLGYKQSKWVTQISFVSSLPSRKGYWEDKGYEWYGGL